ncbi:DUF4118 domain-containing protein [Rhodopseudomonas pseudopalustris]|uniref:histidine kinase n=1 Tax=Rhodopseudomonas pseudopalustris TaxID=1513892 RepID=A0A1H8XBL7_9BRAD|nr:DUF4118 domain-containing protein [Rhodopseudomonas pseudopalustris]SEP37239.1 Two-component sensor histidine kinase, contains HisKA and HATPase domains [Rhodopseudomonas pseudopalustris]
MGALPSIGLVVALVLIATGVRILLGFFGATLPFATFFPCVMISALIGGWLPGLLSIALSILVGWYVFISPQFAFAPLYPVMAADFGVFAISSVAVVSLAILHRGLVFTYEDMRTERDLMARETLHRSRNQLAVVISLIRKTVRDSGDAEKTVERIKIAKLTEDLLEQNGPLIGDLHDLIDKVVRNAHPEQVQISGPQVSLSTRLARALGLALHEMTTNAVKYGSLSNGSGAVRIEWTQGEHCIDIRWIETGGPAVYPPQALGFGSTLIDRMLTSVGGKHEVVFAESGCRHRIQLMS